MISCNGVKSTLASGVEVPPKPCITLQEQVIAAHMKLAAAVLNGQRFVPFDDIRDHQTVYIVVRMLRDMGVNDEVIDYAFEGWTEYPEWTLMEKPGWLLILHDMEPGLSNPLNYIVAHTELFGEFIHESVEVARAHIATNEMLLARTCNMLSSLPLESLFTGNNSEVRKTILQMNSARRNQWQDLLIDPYELKMKLARVHDTREHFYAPISPLKEIPTGASTLARYQLARARLSDLTEGLIDDPEFPYESVVISGSIVQKVTMANYHRKVVETSDIDIFICETNLDKYTVAVIKVLECIARLSDYTTFYSTKVSLITVEATNINRTFQVICSNAASPYDVISSFDSTHIQWCYHNGDFLATGAAILACVSRVTSFWAIHDCRYKRVVKTFHAGFRILNNTKAKKVPVDLIEMCKPENLHKLQQTLDGLHLYYHPTSTHILSEGEIKNIKAILQKIHEVPITYTSIIDVMNNVRLGGSFDRAYGAMYDPVSFRVNLLTNTPFRNHVGERLKTASGNVALNSSKCHVTAIAEKDFGNRCIGWGEAKVLTCTTQSVEFNNFLRYIDEDISAHFSAVPVTERLLKPDGTFTAVISRSTLQSCENVPDKIFMRGKFSAKNLTEDLRPGIDIIFTFNIICIIDNDHRYASKFFILEIKYINVDEVLTELPNLEIVHDDTICDPGELVYD